MNKVAGVIVFKAKPGLGDEVADTVAAALPLVQAEDGTPLWLWLRSSVDPDTLFLVDLFTDHAARDTHMAGSAADWILQRVPNLLAAAPEIHPSELIVSKLG